MAFEGIPINSGTGPTVLVDQSGTAYAQVVKIVQGGDGVFDSLAATLAVSGTVSANVVGTVPVTMASLATGTVNVVNVLSASGITVASVTTGTMSVVNVLSASGVTVASVTTGTMNVVNVLSASGVTIASITAGTVGLGTAQYAANSTNLGTTGQGLLVMGIQSGATTARGLVIGTTGGLFIDSMPAVGGGQQYSAANTNMGATGTGTLIIGLQTGATTGRALALSTTGGLIIATMPAVGGGQQYAVDSTTMNATATGTIILGMQTGATTGRGIAVTTTGAQLVAYVGTPAVTAANITVASVTTGTMSVVNVLSASGVTIASMTTGTVNASLMATTANVGAIVQTAHASNWNAFAVSTTSGGGHAILRTSGAHTLYVTDLMFSVDVPMVVNVYSSSAAQTPKITAYLATRGGFTMQLRSPLVLTSAQSLVFIGNLSGSCAAFAAGYTVT